MSEDEYISQLRRMLSAHAKVVGCLAALDAMRHENDERRSHGKPDAYSSNDFRRIEDEVRKYADQINPDSK